MLAATIVECNQPFARIYGVSSANELIGAPFGSLILSNDRFIERARRFVTSGYRLFQERIEWPAGGQLKQYLNANVAGEIRDSCLIRMWLAIEDISLRCLVEQAIEQGKENLHVLAKRIDYAFWILNWNAFKVDYVGPDYESVWRISATDMYEDPMCWLDVVHPDDRERVSNAFLSQVRYGHFDETFRLLLPDGTIRVIRNLGFPLPDLDGQSGRVVGLAKDITEPIETRTGLNHIFDSSREMLVVVDAEGHFRQVNAAFARTTGYEDSELCGKQVIDYLLPEDRESTVDTVKRLNGGKAAVDVQNRFLFKDQSVHSFRWNVAPVAETGVLYASVTDLSAKSKMEVPSSVRTLFETLTPREIEIMHLIVDGEKNKSIANKLQISQRTVEKHRERVMKKMHAESVADLVRMAISIEYR